MTTRNLVNLDAMIARADFALIAEEQQVLDSINGIGLRDLTRGSLLLPVLRKPDFQRETNHWTPEQVVSLLKCFVEGDLIPSVILWRSRTNVFVIDGGHRLSVLRAWIEDDYGDGAISQQFFGYVISSDQKRTADRTRELVIGEVGKYSEVVAKLEQQSLPEEERARYAQLAARALPIQWVRGDAEKAEASFFKINTEGTPLDDVEELLLKNRRKPVAIAARAVIRAGAGHRYWSAFAPENVKQIENAATRLHRILFEPEVRQPIKTLDLPLGGSKGVRTALQVLIDFILIANRDQVGSPKSLADEADDDSGASTASALAKAERLAAWITGNDRGSLGLHPAIYFYGATGVHSGPLFMGTVILVARKLVNNDKAFFSRFSRVRQKLEQALIEHKSLVMLIVQRPISTKRADTYATLFDKMIIALEAGVPITDEWLVANSGFTGKVIVGLEAARREFTDETKSKVFIEQALASAMRCDFCAGYLDPNKSISYDHHLPRRDGGDGSSENLRLLHPYCNQALKN